MRRCAAALAALWLPAGGVAAQTAAEPAAPAAAPPGPAADVIPAGTVVHIAIDDALSASASHEGQPFRLHLAEPIVLAGRTLVPAGTEGGGEVIEAKRPGLAGKPGVLILAARYLAFGDVRIPLGHLRYGQTGRNNEVASIVAMAAIGLPGALVGGGDVKAAAGLRASAKVTSDVPLPAHTTSSASTEDSNQTKQGSMP